ncbi:AzlC family ABC transporter permease [Thiolinea disciformis]|uniref:AzlC family ABC transporter permease n=1 Tax=Thiolinea disciformis TaxID=125614 RepID=UPI00037BB39D|nr:AzlC family ABC transporter permease [Thiolinea disciformis]
MSVNTVPILHKWPAMRFGALVSLPMIIGNMPFGFIFGSLAVSQGLPLWVPMAMSFFVFAGSAQFVAIGLLAAGAPLWVIISTTFIVNLRHLLYAADFMKYVRHLSLKWRALMAFGLIDETYAAVTPYYQNGRLHLEVGHWAYLGSFLAFYTIWNVTTFLGVVAGKYIPNMSQWGLEFAMVATFLGIITPYLRSLPYWTVFLVSGGLAVVLYNLPNNLGMLIAALLGVAAGLLSEQVQTRFKSSAEVQP